MTKRRLLISLIFENKHICLNKHSVSKRAVLLNVLNGTLTSILAFLLVPSSRRFSSTRFELVSASTRNKQGPSDWTMNDIEYDFQNPRTSFRNLNPKKNRDNPPKPLNIPHFSLISSSFCYILQRVLQVWLDRKGNFDYCGFIIQFPDICYTLELKTCCSHYNKRRTHHSVADSLIRLLLNRPKKCNPKKLVGKKRLGGSSTKILNIPKLTLFFYKYLEFFKIFRKFLKYLQK